MTGIRDLLDAPEDVRVELLDELDACWFRSCADYRAATEELARQEVVRKLGYLLVMFWQGRTDKFRSNLRPVLIWITENFVPDDTLARAAGNPAAARAFGVTLFPCDSHDDLARKVMDQVFEAYRKTPGVELPLSGSRPSDRTSLPVRLVRRLKSLFGDPSR